MAKFMDVHKEAVLRVHEKAGHPADEIYEVPVEIA